jgi:ATP phosphoribosyltransferase regulatory subunit
MHMAARAEPARYTYAGEVFRRQEADENRPNEYLQVGFEVFDGARPVAADAEVLATVMAALDGLPLRVATGDIGILTAAVRGLTTTEARKAALLRHIWRPRRFLSLIDRFAGRTPVPPGRAALLAARDRGEDPLAGRTVIGQRGAEEIAARIEALAADAAAPPIPAEEVALIGELLALSGPAPEAARALAALADRMPALAGAAATFAARLEALAARGIDPEALGFEASFGRNAMEYYDGFVFGLFAPGRDDLPPVATGGRYDALTAVLGQGRAVPAVGAVIRPEVVLALRGAA